MIISNYIFKQTLRNVVVSTMVFISVVWLSQSFKTIKLIINKGAGISDFMILSAYSFPSWLLIALPFGMFAGSMISYIRLENDKEIVVMKAAGISFMGVSSPAIIIAIIASIILFLNVHFLLPFSYANFKALQNEIRDSSQELVIKNNIFVDLNNTQTIYIGKLGNNNKFEEIFIQDRTDPEKVIEFFSKDGFLNREGNKVFFYMNKGTRISTDLNNISTIMDFEKYNFLIKQDKKKIITNGIRIIEYNEYNFFELIKKADTDKTNKGKLLAEAHNRNTICLLPIIYTLIAMIGALNGSHTRKPSIHRKILSISLLILVQSLTIVLKNMAHFNLILLPVMYLFPLILILAGIIILYKGVNILNFKRNIL